MRVLVAHNRYRSEQPSGENSVVDDEIQLLAAAGCDVERLELESDAIAGWPIHRRATLPLRVVWSHEGSRLGREAIARFRPDIVHVHNTFPLFSPSLLWAARRSPAAVVQTLHNFRPLCASADFLRQGRVCEKCLGRLPVPAVIHGCYRGSRTATTPLAVMVSVHRLLRTWTRCVDMFVLPSEFARAKYAQAGWPIEKLAVKYNTASANGCFDAERDGSFACLSRLGPQKGIDVLLAAWAEAFPQGGQVLRIIGSGEEEKRLRSAAENLQGVEFSGQRPHADAIRVLARSRALALPSLSYEVFPRVVAEAYSVGVPVIASRIGALPEIVEDGRTGLLVEAGSPHELAGALKAVAESTELAASLGRGAKAAFDSKYAPARTTEQLLMIYEHARSVRGTAG
jgi:glycosyltransferase involved in cell wall biosynthesis